VDLDDAAAIAALDTGDMLGTVAALGEHIEAGYASGLATTGLPSLDGVTSVVFCGMGGSIPAASACALRHLASCHTNDLGTSLIGAKPPTASP